MKRIITAYVAAAVLASAVPAMAVEHSHAAGDANCAKECQMLVRNCAQETDTIQERISKLEREIGKGNAVYTRQELQTLESKLKDAQDTLANITQGG